MSLPGTSCCSIVEVESGCFDRLLGPALARRVRETLIPSGRPTEGGRARDCVRDVDGLATADAVLDMTETSSKNGSSLST